MSTDLLSRAWQPPLPSSVRGHTSHHFHVDPCHASFHARPHPDLEVGLPAYCGDASSRGYGAMAMCYTLMVSSRTQLSVFAACTRLGSECRTDLDDIPMHVYIPLCALVISKNSEFYYFFLKVAYTILGLNLQCLLQKKIIFISSLLFFHTPRHCACAPPAHTHTLPFSFSLTSYLFFNFS